MMPGNEVRKGCHKQDANTTNHKGKMVNWTALKTITSYEETSPKDWKDTLQMRTYSQYTCVIEDS